MISVADTELAREPGRSRGKHTEIATETRSGAGDTDGVEGGDPERGEAVEDDQDRHPGDETDHRRGGPVAGVLEVYHGDVRQQRQQRPEQGYPAHEEADESPDDRADQRGDDRVVVIVGPDDDAGADVDSQCTDQQAHDEDDCRSDW